MPSTALTKPIVRGSRPRDLTGKCVLSPTTLTTVLSGRLLGASGLVRSRGSAGHGHTLIAVAPRLSDGQDLVAMRCLVSGGR